MLTNFSTAKYFLLTLSTQTARKLLAYYNRELASLGITAQQMIALGILCFQEDLSLGEFAEQMNIRKATAVSMIKRLEAMDLVTKETHPEDARLNVLKITEKTRDLIPRLHEKAVELEDAIEAQIGAPSLKRLVEDLSLLLRIEL